MSKERRRWKDGSVEKVKDVTKQCSAQLALAAFGPKSGGGTRLWVVQTMKWPPFALVQQC